MADLEHFASHIRMMPTVPSVGDVAAFSDMETALFISHRHNLFVVERTSRGGPRQVMGSFRTLDDAQRLLIFIIGSAWRGERGLRQFRWRELSPLASIDEGPTSIYLEWANGSGEFPLGLGGRSTALDYSHLVSFGLDTLLDAFASASGEPVLDADPEDSAVTVTRPPQRVPHAKSCRVSRAVVSGSPISRMKRETPLNSSDSGWRFFAELDNRDLSLNATNSQVRNFNAVADAIPPVAQLYEAPVGSEFAIVGDSIEALN